jgi:hypothetical protein
VGRRREHCGKVMYWGGGGRGGGASLHPQFTQARAHRSAGSRTTDCTSSCSTREGDDTGVNSRVPPPLRSLRAARHPLDKLRPQLSHAQTGDVVPNRGLGCRGGRSGCRQRRRRGRHGNSSHRRGSSRHRRRGRWRGRGCRHGARRCRRRAAPQHGVVQSLAALLAEQRVPGVAEAARGAHKRVTVGGATRGARPGGRSSRRGAGGRGRTRRRGGQLGHKGLQGGPGPAEGTRRSTTRGSPRPPPKHTHPRERPRSGPEHPSGAVGKERRGMPEVAGGCDVVWCDMVRRGAMWCGAIWCDVVWCDVVRRGVVRCGVGNAPNPLKHRVGAHGGLLPAWPVGLLRQGHPQGRKHGLQGPPRLLVGQALRVAHPGLGRCQRRRALGHRLLRRRQLRVKAAGLSHAVEGTGAAGLRNRYACGPHTVPRI